MQGIDQQLLANLLEDMKKKRDELDREICAEEQEKQSLQSDIQILQKRKAQLEDSISQKAAIQYTCGQTLEETENAYSKIVQSSSSLLQVLKAQGAHLQRRAIESPVQPTHREPLQQLPTTVHTAPLDASEIKYHMQAAQHNFQSSSYQGGV
ncbi:hypothetical protein CYMTET_54205 [Cymbomonas tetramitiformis]|uniref:Uncharacterized protein n=1 Tax=Cymbomonas tetramitiformis TaxID=36881 RepID=A0AAE0ENY7_9CHLO|nr:hypothetical protein CYMTET_54205 [Cymbomonas tetramitiformis]